MDLNTEIEDKTKTLKETQNTILDIISSKIGEDDEQLQHPNYTLYKYYFKKEKLIYLNLNKCKVRDNVIDGDVWIPEEKYQELLEKLGDLTNQNESHSSAQFIDIQGVDNSTPPTFIETNEFTSSFQEIVNTYGVPRYREVNPALFNIVTFPFLFGVMFGDIGHGFLLILFSCYLFYDAEELKKPKALLKDIYKARHLFLLMGFFAFYCGWMYNDFISMPLNLFGTCYTNQEVEAVRVDGSCVYPFGLDPKWYVAKNELTYFNSLKMKTAVILGVTQMLLGICLRGMNNIYFKDYLGFVFEFIPQFIFMSLLFGYMNIMIIIKWLTVWADTKMAPSIINTLMMIFLKLGSTVKKYFLIIKK
jgi:V-type H+-transporting ATPase subunit a